MLLLPLYLFANSNLSQTHLLELCNKVDLKTSSNKDIKIIHSNGISKMILSPDKKRLSIITMLTVSTKNQKTLLEKINNFNKKLLFSKVYLEKNTLTLHSDLNIKHKVSDTKIINFIATFLAIRDTFIPHFTTLKD